MRTHALYPKAYSPHGNRLASKTFALPVGQFRSAGGLALLGGGFSEASDYLPPQIFGALGATSFCALRPTVLVRSALAGSALRPHQ